MRECRECGVSKPEDEYHEYKPGRRRLMCRPCVLAKKRKWRRENASRVQRLDHNKHLMRKFGITLDEYERMAEAQGHVCAICGQPEGISHRGNKTSRLAVDHNHETGEVRALLCFKCNTSLGHFENNGLLTRALAYLEGYHVV